MTSFNVFGDPDRLMDHYTDHSKHMPDDVESIVGDAYGHTVGDAYGHTVGDAYGHTVGAAYGHTVGDAYGHTVGADAVNEATKKILTVAQKDRAVPPCMDVVPVECEVDESCVVEDVLGYEWEEIVGDNVASSVSASPAPSATATPAAPATDHLPILRRLYNYFKSMVPSTKLVRLDTPESYKDFVSKKDFKTLDGRVRELRSFVEAHTADHHGAAVNPLGVWDTILGDDGASEHEVPLSLPPSTKKHIKSWREGDRICTSVALPGHDGRPRIATASTNLKEHVDDLVDYMDASGVDPTEILGVLPDLACVLGGGSLVPEIANAAPALLADPASKGDKPVIRKMVPEDSSGRAALMALCQQCQAGDPDACMEWGLLAEISKHHDFAPLGDLMLESANRLQTAQHLR